MPILSGNSGAIALIFIEFWDDRSRFILWLYQSSVCLSVWHTCDLWPHLSTDRNTLGVVGKPPNSSLRKSKFSPDRSLPSPQICGFSPWLAQWKDIYASDAWRLTLHIDVYVFSSQVSLAYACVPSTAWMALKYSYDKHEFLKHFLSWMPVMVI